MNDDTDPQSQHDGSASGPISGLLHSTRQLLATLLLIVQTRLELFTVELQEEVYRLAVSLMWSLAALFALGLSCFLGALTLIFIFWDTHRILVSISVTMAFFGLALLAALLAAKKMRTRSLLLQGTLAELRRDQDLLRSKP